MVVAAAGLVCGRAVCVRFASHPEQHVKHMPQPRMPGWCRFVTMGTGSGVRGWMDNTDGGGGAAFESV